MATDTLLTISMITNESLMVLENELTFTSEVLRTYDDSFGVDGAKIGDTLNVRRPRVSSEPRDRISRSRTSTRPRAGRHR
jgi:hypothetical protein